MADKACSVCGTDVGTVKRYKLMTIGSPYSVAKVFGKLTGHYVCIDCHKRFVSRTVKTKKTSFRRTVPSNLRTPKKKEDEENLPSKCTVCTDTVKRSCEEEAGTSKSGSDRKRSRQDDVATSGSVRTTGKGTRQRRRY